MMKNTSPTTSRIRYSHTVFVNSCSFLVEINSSLADIMSSLFFVTKNLFKRAGHADILTQFEKDMDSVYEIHLSVLSVDASKGDQHFTFAKTSFWVHRRASLGKRLSLLLWSDCKVFTRLLLNDTSCQNQTINHDPQSYPTKSALKVDLLKNRHDPPVARGQPPGAGTHRRHSELVRLLSFWFIQSTFGVLNLELRSAFQTRDLRLLKFMNVPMKKAHLARGSACFSAFVDWKQKEPIHRITRHVASELQGLEIS